MNGKVKKKNLGGKGVKLIEGWNVFFQIDTIIPIKSGSAYMPIIT